MSLTENNKAIRVVGFDDKKLQNMGNQIWSVATLRGYSIVLRDRDPKILS